MDGLELYVVVAKYLTDEKAGETVVKHIFGSTKSELEKYVSDCRLKCILVTKEF